MSVSNSSSRFHNRFRAFRGLFDVRPNMRALRFYSKGDLRLEDVAVPFVQHSTPFSPLLLLTSHRDCGPDEVRLDIAYCGICGSDLHEYHAGPILAPKHGLPHPQTGASLPITLGHEFSGTVVEIGTNVQDYQVGDKVTVNPALDDRHYNEPACDLCQIGRPNLCKRSAFYGINHDAGGFAEQIVIKACALFKLPPNVSLKLAALAEPLAVAWHMVRLSGFKAGDNVVVLGAGPIGCALTFLLKSHGAEQVIVSELSRSRAAQARSFGADKVIDPTKRPDSPQQGTMTDSQQSTMDPVLLAVQSSMGLGADIVFDACGLQSTLDTAITCTKPAGTIFNVAIHDRPLQIQLNQLTLAEKRLMAGNAYTKEDFETVLDILSKKGDEAEKLITALVPLERVVRDGFNELVGNAAGHVKILIEARGEA